MLRTGAVREFSYRKGVIVATFAGIMSACFAYGLATAKPIDTFARANLIQGGRSDLWQHLPGLVVVLWGGFTTNFLWCAWLLVKNRSASQFLGRTAQGRIAVRSMALNIAASATAGLLWYFQFFFYSMGQTRMGRYDFSSWTLHMAGTILFATLWGVVLHEWSGTTRSTRMLGAAGFLLLVLSSVVVGYGNYLKVL
jgi:L-rhamnose-H+ transport protein